MDRVEAEELVRKYGAKTTSSVSNRTTYLVYGETLEDGRHYTEGRKYKISIEKEKVKIISENEFKTLLSLRCNWVEAVTTKESKQTVTITYNSGTTLEYSKKTMVTDGRLWIDKYAPQRVEDIVGNNIQISMIYDYLFHYYDYFGRMNYKNISTKQRQKLLMIIGPCGIGKSLLIKLIVERLEFKPVYINCNELRSGRSIKKSLYHDLIVGNMVFKKNIEMLDKLVVIIEDYDGLLDDDHGLTAYLMDIVKISVHPILISCINSTGSRIRRLTKFSHVIKLEQVDKLQIVKHMYKILIAEELKADGNALEDIVESCGGDMRASIINLQLAAQMHDNITSECVQVNTFKDSFMPSNTPFKLAGKMLNGYKWDKLAQGQKLICCDEHLDVLPEYFFENYLDAFGEVHVLGDSNRLADIAEFCALGDCISRFNRDQDNILAKDVGIISCVMPACYVRGLLKKIEYPNTLLFKLEYYKNLNLRCKIEAVLKEHRIDISPNCLTAEYIPLLCHVVFTHLIYNGVHAVEDVVLLLREQGFDYYFFKEYLTELEWKNMTPEYYLYNNLNQNNFLKVTANKFTLIDSLTLEKVRKRDRKFNKLNINNKNVNNKSFPDDLIIDCSFQDNTKIEKNLRNIKEIRQKYKRYNDDENYEKMIENNSIFFELNINQETAKKYQNSEIKRKRV